MGHPLFLIFIEITSVSLELINEDLQTSLRFKTLALVKYESKGEIKRLYIQALDIQEINFTNV